MRCNNGQLGQRAWQEECTARAEDKERESGREGGEGMQQCALESWGPG